MSGHRGKWDWSVREDYLWTTRSTGFFGRASIGPAPLCLHCGIIILFFAHFAGFIRGAYNLISWIDFFRWLGGWLAAGIIFGYGIVWALVRRITIPQVKAMSTPDDYTVLLFLIIISGFGLYQSCSRAGLWNTLFDRTLDRQYFQTVTECINDRECSAYK